MNSQDNSGKYIDFFTVKLLTSDEGLYKSEVISISILLFSSIGMISAARMHPCYEVTIVKRRFQEISVSVQATFVFL